MPRGYNLNFNEEQINDILELHNKGLKDKEIAEIYKIGRTTVGQILNKQGIYRNLPIEAKVKSVMKLYNEGKNQTEIYQELHMDMKNVRKILRENNVDITKNSWKPTYEIDEAYFDCLDTPNKAYILGLLYADGNLAKDSSTIKLFLQEQDKALLERILIEFKSTHPLHFYDYSHKPNHQNQYGFYICNRFMYSSLLKYGLTPNKSLTITYPQKIPDKLQRHFIRGYFDGDGTMHSSKNGKYCGFIGTLDFCNVAKSIIESNVDVHCSIYQYNNNKITSNLQISGGKQVPKFLSWIYDDSDLYLERKFQKYRDNFAALHNSTY